MKRIYLLMISALSIGAVQAQQGIVLEKSIMEKTNIKQEKPVKAPVAPTKSTVIWSNELDNPGEWILSNTSNPDADWVLTDTWPTNLDQFDPPMHATAANGYAVIDSDQYGNGATQNVLLEYDGIVDLSAYSDVQLEFSSYKRRFQASTDQYYIEFSVDDTTWNTIELMADFPNGTTSDNPRIETINVSNAVGGEASVQFRFRYIGDWGWFWSIDDIKFVEAEDYDLRIDNLGFYAGDMSVIAPELVNGVEYYMLPESQITPVNKFTATVENIGALDQQNAKINVDVLDGATGNSLQLLQGAEKPLAVPESDTFAINQPYTYPGEGEYIYKYFSSPDEDDLNTGNDTIFSESIMVGSPTYARDNGVPSGSITNSQTNTGSPMNIGNVFEFFGSFSMVSVDVAIANRPEYVGQSLYAYIYKYDPAEGTFEFEFDSQDYTIQDGEQGGFVTIPLTDLSGNEEVIQAEAGDIFLVTVGHYGGDDDDQIAFLTAQDVEDRSVYFFNASGEMGIFGGVSAMMIRPNSDPFASTSAVSNNNFNINVYPNPAQGETNVSFELENASDVAVSLTDMSGKVVYSDNIANVAAGKNQLTIPTEGLSNGVYFYNFAAGNNIVTEKIVINK